MPSSVKFVTGCRFLFDPVQSASENTQEFLQPKSSLLNRYIPYYKEISAHVVKFCGTFYVRDLSFRALAQTVLLSTNRKGYKSGLRVVVCKQASCRLSAVNVTAILGCPDRFTGDNSQNNKAIKLHDFLHRLSSQEREISFAEWIYLNCTVQNSIATTQQEGKYGGDKNFCKIQGHRREILK